MIRNFSRIMFAVMAVIVILSALPMTASADEKALFKVEDTLYDDLNEAVAAGTTVVLSNNGTLPAGNYTIPAGVTLLIPKDEENTVYTNTPERYNKDDYDYVTPTAYRTLRMANGANITVNGVISVAGSQYAGGVGSIVGGVHGPVGFIRMDTGSKITVSNGAYLYAWGYIVGSGEVEVLSGGTVYESFQITDWRGLAAMANAFDDDNNHIMPISQFYVQNIEVSMKLNAGAIENGYFCATITMAGIQGIEVPLVGAEYDNLFSIDSGYLIKDYVEAADRRIYKIYGNVSIKKIRISMNLFALSVVTLDSSNYVLPVTNNLTVDICSGTMNIPQDICLLPGAELIIRKGAQCNVADNKSIYAYDVSDWGGYVGAMNSSFIPLGYAPGRTANRTNLNDAKIQIDGTLNAPNGYIYTTNSGAVITCGETAIVRVKQGTQTETYQFSQVETDLDTISIPVISAKLDLNASTTTNNIYNLGEETYSFKNFGDEDSAGGHCFGMSATSSGYYLGFLSKSNIGLNNGDTLYSLNFNSTVKTPICHYQAIQGKARDESIVAGGTYFKYWPFYNIKSDWKEIVNYVKNHEHDGAGDLIIGYTKKSEGCHAINFLRYEVVDGQERIYAYDSNFPDKETYFYQDVNDYVRQAVRSTFSGSIDCIALVDVNEFFSRTGNFIMAKTFYAPANSIEIEGAYVSPMCVGETTDEILMYEILDEETEVVVTPLVDNATFTYMDNEYSFDKINEDTYAEFTLSTSEEDEPVFEIINVPHEHIYDEAKTEPSCTEEGSIIYTCSCGDTYTETITANGHTDSEWIVDSNSTCAKEGSKHIECTVCETIVKTETIAKLPHDYNSVVTAPTCTTEGYTVYTCACGDSYIDNVTGLADHKDADGDEFCDYCDEYLGSEAENNCSHMCHKSGFVGFIWKIVKFFWKLFGMNPVCECGAAHY